MQSPNLHVPYSVETKYEHILKFTRVEADTQAVNFQQTGKDVEVWHEGILQYKLHGIEQGKLF
jgi:hypothetical protein